MTNVEAIKILKRGSNCCGNCEQCDKCTEVDYKEALDLAIEALYNQDKFNDLCDAPIKTGHWIERLVRGSKVLYCSVCGNGIDVIYEYDYCPNCGAKMEECE